MPSLNSLETATITPKTPQCPSGKKYKRLVEEINHNGITDLPVSIAHADVLPDLCTMTREQVLAIENYQPPKKEAKDVDMPFLKDLYSFRLLKPDEQRNLFAHFTLTRLDIVDLLSKPVDDAQFVKELKSKYKDVLSIKKVLIESNLRLVANVVKKYISRDNRFDDLLTPGIDAVQKAVDKFDVTRGFVFSTYCTWAIKRSIAYYSKKEFRYKQKNEQFEDGDNEGSYSNLVHCSQQTDITREEVFNTLFRVIEELDEKSQFVIKQRFGLKDGCKKKILKEIGIELGVSKERVRQIEGNALNKLRRKLEQLGIVLETLEEE